MRGCSYKHNLCEAASLSPRNKTSSVRCALLLSEFKGNFPSKDHAVDLWNLIRCKSEIECCISDLNAVYNIFLKHSHPDSNVSIGTLFENIIILILKEYFIKKEISYSCCSKST